MRNLSFETFSIRRRTFDTMVHFRAYTNAQSDNKCMPLNNKTRNTRNARQRQSTYAHEMEREREKNAII